jgi:hypothetical protein
MLLYSCSLVFNIYFHIIIEYIQLYIYIYIYIYINIIAPMQNFQDGSLGTAASKSSEIVARTCIASIIIMVAVYIIGKLEYI